jgi:hypothetical protein
MRSLWYTSVHLLARSTRRTRRTCSTLAVTALTVAGVAAVAGASPAGAAPAARARPVTPAISPDDPTASFNDLRTGWDPNEPTLTPTAVNGPNFGQIFSTSVKGQVYAQPLVIGNTVIVATEKDWVYGINATTGAVLWSTQVGTAYHITSCSDLTPDIGITSAPVYDPSTNTVYVMALVKKISFEWHLFGIDVSTGAVTLAKRIAGSPTNNSHLTFNAIQQGQRAGLLLMNGWVYAAFASHCDHTPYAGYVAGVHVAQRPLQTTLWTDEAGVSSGKLAGIWQSGGGIMSDGSGRIFVATGNGISPPKSPGNTPPGELAESVTRLAPSPTDGSLSPQDFFSPANAPSLDTADHDFGSGGPVGLPFGTSTYPDLVTVEGKGGTLYILNRDNLGGREQGSGNGDQDLADLGPLPEHFGHPAAFGDTTTLTSSNASSSSDYMVFVGKQDYMRELKFGVSSSDKPTITDDANSTFTLGFSSGSPIITSNGTDPASAIIWAVNSSGSTGTGSSLGAWDLLPQPKAGGGTKLREIWSGSIGTASKFSIAATSNGVVYVGTRDGKLLAFGLKSGAALQRSTTVSYPDTALGSAASTPVSVTATRTVTVTGTQVTAMSTPAPFTVGTVTETHNGSTTPVTFPVTLHKGDALHAPVTFTPAAPGGATGQVTFTTTAAKDAAAVPLIGDGTQTGLFATSTALSFAIVENEGTVVTNVPVGVTVPLTTAITNGGDTPVTVTSVTPPTGPYTAQNLPKVGTVIKPGASVTVQITYVPQAVATSNGSFTVTASKGTSATVTLTGTSLAPLTKFTASPSTVHFGPVRVGHTARVLVHVVNAGNQPSLMKRTPGPGGAFGAPLRVPNGLPVNGGYDLELPVTFHPTKAGAFTGVYVLRWTDHFGTHTLNVPITGTGVG